MYPLIEHNMELADGKKIIKIYSSKIYNFFHKEYIYSILLNSSNLSEIQS